MAVNTRVVYFLAFLVVVLPVITGILVWQLLPDCDADDNQPETTHAQSQTTSRPDNRVVTTVDPYGDGPWKTLRLPRDVIPEHYIITLFPDFYGNNSWFHGNVSMELRVERETHYILVHVNYLNISHTSLVANCNDTVIDIKRTFEYRPNQVWVIETMQPLNTNTTVCLNMEFGGSLTRSIVGLYKSTYTNSLTNDVRSIATSKFEPVAARRAFPCMDEPNLKAEYSVRLVHRPGYTALSNMPAQITHGWSEDGGLQVTEFRRSVRMSTYLVCFIVCDFTFIERRYNNVSIRLYAPDDRINQTRYALDVAVTTVKTYTELFNVSYPLPKLDLISIPDFVSGAMEHWGLITFRETNLLYDPNQASSANKQRVAIVVAHEVSHQWFGNLVTMDWWQDLWLNEGFASYMEYIGAAAQEPNWHLDEQFLVDDLQPVMVTDAGLSSHPIVVDVQDPNQINAVFDSISYSKGSSIIRMLKHWMGSTKFFNGISTYLKEFRFRTARTDDLWDHLGKVSPDLSVRSVMDTWTKQMGLPYLQVSVDHSGHRVTVHQQRFLADSAVTYNVTDSPYGYLWYIKLDYKTRTGGNTTWMSLKPSVSFSVKDDLRKEPTAVLKFNMGETGFYRVNYPEFLWRQNAMELAKVKRSIFNAADRANLIDDAFNLARAKLLGYDVALDMTLYLSNETDYVPWISAADGFRYISNMLEFTGNFGLLQQYILRQVSPLADKLGWKDNGTHLERRLRATILSHACSNGHTQCLSTAQTLFQSWLYNGTVIPPNLRSLVYKYGMIGSSSSRDWDAVWARYENEAVVQEKVKLLSALAKTRSVSLLIRYLEYAQDETKIRSQDFFTVLTYIAGNPVGRALVWDWIRENWTYMVKRFTLYSRYFGHLIPNVVSDFNTEFQLHQVESFLALYPEAGAGEAGRKQALESIRRNIDWMGTSRPTVVAWLNNNH